MLTTSKFQKYLSFEWYKSQNTIDNKSGILKGFLFYFKRQKLRKIEAEFNFQN